MGRLKGGYRKSDERRRQRNRAERENGDISGRKIIRNFPVFAIDRRQLTGGLFYADFIITFLKPFKVLPISRV
jgi:hypothetical protein